MGLNRGAMEDSATHSRVRAADGYELRYRTWGDPNAARATLVLLNGVMSHSLWLQPLAEPLHRAGYYVIGADRRGSGPNLAARGDAPSAEVLVDDLLQLLAAEGSRLEGKPLFVVGWCWGAVLALNLLIARRERFDGAVLVTPALCPSEVIRQALRERSGQTNGSDEGLACIRSPVCEEMFTRGPLLDGFIRTDDQRCRYHSPRFDQIMRRMAVRALASIRSLQGPLLLILADADVVTDNAATLRAFSRARQGTVEVARFPGAHGLQFEAPQALADRLRAWADDPSGSRTAVQGRPV